VSGLSLVSGCPCSCSYHRHLNRQSHHQPLFTVDAAQQKFPFPTVKQLSSIFCIYATLHGATNYTPALSTPANSAFIPCRTFTWQQCIGAAAPVWAHGVRSGRPKSPKHVAWRWPWRTRSSLSLHSLAWLFYSCRDSFSYIGKDQKGATVKASKERAAIQ